MPFLTEEEAKQKMCPVGKMRAGYDGNWDKGECIASQCMAWRFETIGSMKRRNGLTAGQMAPAKEYFGGSGYCGLAGRPE